MFVNEICAMWTNRDVLFVPILLLLSYSLHRAETNIASHFNNYNQKFSFQLYNFYNFNSFLT